jgi:hypothetical protein
VAALLEQAQTLLRSSPPLTQRADCKAEALQQGVNSLETQAPGEPEGQGWRRFVKPGRAAADFFDDTEASREAG